MKGKTIKYILGIILPLMMVLSLGLMTAAPVFAADLTGVTNTLTNNAAGATTTHTVAFTTVTNLPVNGKMKVAFPSGFDISGATLGTVTGPDGTKTLSRDGQVLIVSRSGGTVFGAGAVTIAFNGVVNHQAVGDAYTVDVVTTDAFNGYIDGPTTSNAFEIVPADLAALVVVQQPTSTVAGVAIAPAVTVRAEDAFGNVIASVDINVAEAGGYVFDTGTLQQPTDATGIATFADLVIKTADTGYVLQFTSGAVGPEASNAFNVIPDALDELQVVDQPQNTVAGQPIQGASPVTVRALDQYDNPIENVVVNVDDKVYDNKGTLGQSGDGSATLSTGQVHSGTYSVLLDSGTGTPGDEGRIAIQLYAGTTLNDINSISWWEYNAAGYPPHVDIKLDLNGNGTWDGTGGGDDALVFEYAYNNPTHYTNEAPMPYGAITGAWYQTFSDDDDGPAAIGDTSNGWLTSGPPGPWPFTGLPNCIGGTLAEWKAGTVTGGTHINGNTSVLSLEIEVDNWGVNSQAYVDDVTVNGTTGAANLGGTTQQTTDVDGIAAFDNLVINTAGTGYVLQFTSGTFGPVGSDPFDVTPCSCNTLTIQNQPTQTVAGDPISPAVTVLAQDQFGNPRVGDAIDVALNKGAFAAGSTLQETTGADGIATFDDLVINTADTDYMLTFSSGAVNSGLSNAFNVVAGDLATLTVQVQPTQTVAGDPISPAVTVLAQDQYDNPRAGDAINVAENTGRDAKLAGTKTRNTAANGIATFDNLVINTADTDYQLRFTSGAAPAEDSDLFDVVALNSLVIIDEPQNTVAGQPIQGASPVTVQALDTLDNPISGIVVEVTLNKGAFASGTTPQTTGVDGIATFGNLVIETADTGYQLHFASGLKTDDSALFNVVAADVDILTVEVQPTDAAANAVISPAVQVKAVDEFNNLIEGLGIDASLLVGTGTLSGTTTQATAANGIATFNDLSIDLPGVKQLQFAADGVSVDSAQFDVGTTAVALNQGWNLMSSSLIPNDTDIEDVLADIIGDVISVWYYDAAANTWLIYSPGGFDTLTTIEDGKAYWINMDAAATLWIDGRELPAPPGLPPVYDVVAGWNMVGFKSTADMSAADYLNAMADKYTRIYDFENGAWFTIPPPNYNDPLMKPGLGYWVSFTEDGAIYP